MHSHSDVLIIRNPLRAIETLLFNKHVCVDSLCDSPERLLYQQTDFSVPCDLRNDCPSLSARPQVEGQVIIFRNRLRQKTVTLSCPNFPSHLNIPSTVEIKVKQANQCYRQSTALGSAFLPGACWIWAQAGAGMGCSGMSALEGDNSWLGKI